MINNFNTAKLIFMGIVRSICKYLMIVMILLFLFSSIIQTSTYIQIYLSGDFSINNDDNITVDGTDYSRVSGKAYLSSFGTVKTEQGWNTHWEEEAWGEIGSKNHNVEEMEEGPYEFDPFSDAGNILLKAAKE